MTQTHPNAPVLHDVTPDAGVPFTPPVFGRTALVDLGGCNPDIIRSPEDIRNWVDNLIGNIKMEAHGDPHILRFGEGDLYGDTHLQFITTSHIVVHTVHKTKCVFIDLTSCATFAAEFIRAEAVTFFQAKGSALHYIERRDPCAEVTS